jgi:hypothetical protein
MTPTPNSENFFGAALGNFDLHENDDMLVAAHWATKNGAKLGESLFHLPKGEINSKGSALIHAGDIVPDTGRVITKLGLLHGHHAGGEYALQVHTDSTTETARIKGGAGPDTGSAVIKGRVNGGGASRATLIAASPGAALSTAARIATASTEGSIHFGPRINAKGDVATVTHITEDVMRLTVGKNVIATTGDTTPTGMVISGMGGVVLGPDGLVFFVAASEENEELLVSNGAETASVLETGVKLFGENGPTLLTIAFGYAREQADTQGRLAFIGEFDDETLSIMLGVPL